MSNIFAGSSTRKSQILDSRLLLAIIIICGLILRAGKLNSPVDYDEAYTVVEFASRSWWTVISDYSLPNNHIFHSLLVRSSLLSLGMHPWSMRIPALLAGLGMIPTAYLLGKTFYSKETGLVSAALVAFFPALVDFSANARGYTLVGLFTLLIFWLAQRAVYQPGPFRWLWMSVCSAFGLWTIPLMFYPAGAAYLWVALEGPRDRKFLTGWLASGLATGLLSALLYSPALIFSGWRRVLNNGFVQPVETKKFFDWLLVVRLQETWDSWTNELPWLLTAILVGGFLLSVLFHKQIGKTRWSLSILLLGWCSLLILVRRPDIFDRFWSWMIAPLLVWSAAGLVETTRRFGIKRVSWPTIISWLSIAGLVLNVSASLPGIPVEWAKVSNIQASASYLADQLQPGDVILAGYPNNASLWYYLKERGIPETAWLAKENANRYLVVLATNQKDQSIESIFKAYNLDPTRIDLENNIALEEYGKIKIYACKTLK